jgi:uncharacterized protein (DUF608 family)
LINQLGTFVTSINFTSAERTNLHFLENPTWPIEWILITPSLFYNIYMYSGNIELLRVNYSKIKQKLLIELENEQNLISTENANSVSVRRKAGFKHDSEKIRALVDWPISERDNTEITDINTVVNCHYFSSLSTMAKIAEILNFSQDVKYYKEKSRRVRKAINTKQFDNNTGLYIDGLNSEHSSLHSNIYPLVFNIAHTKDVEGITKIGIDISKKQAINIRKQGYIPIIADAQNIPFLHVL